MSERNPCRGPVEIIRRFDEATLVERCRLERQLFDGPALRLATLSLQLGLFRHQLTGLDEALRKHLEEIQEELQNVLHELRTVAGCIYPPVLATAGLGAALEAMVEQRGLPIKMHGPDQRYSAAVEAAAYFAITERLLSIECSPSTVTVAIKHAEDGLLLTIHTDGDRAAETAPVVMRIACG